MRRLLLVIVCSGWLICCGGTMPDYCAVELLEGQPDPEMVCRPTTHAIEVDCWIDGGGELRFRGDGEVYLRTRIKTGDPLAGVGACPR